MVKVIHVFSDFSEHETRVNDALAQIAEEGGELDDVRHSAMLSDLHAPQMSTLLLYHVDNPVQAATVATAAISEEEPLITHDWNELLQHDSLREERDPEAAGCGL